MCGLEYDDEERTAGQALVGGMSYLGFRALAWPLMG